MYPVPLLIFSPTSKTDLSSCHAGKKLPPIRGSNFTTDSGHNMGYMGEPSHQTTTTTPTPMSLSDGNKGNNNTGEPTFTSSAVVEKISHSLMLPSLLPPFSVAKVIHLIIQRHTTKLPQHICTPIHTLLMIIRAYMLFLHSVRCNIVSTYFTHIIY